MDLRDLQLFLILAKRRHFERAATEAGISQPGLSVRIRKLEEELGTVLVLRDPPRGTRLTEAGKELQRHALRIMSHVEEARRALGSTPQTAARTFRVGHPPLYRDAVVHCLDRLMDKLPDLPIVIEELPSSRIKQWVQDGRLDLGLVHASMPTRGLTYERLPECPLRLLMNASHFHEQSYSSYSPGNRSGPYGARSVNLDDVPWERFALIRRGLRMRRIIDAYLDKHHLVPNIVLETNSVPSLLLLVGSRRDLATILPVPGLEREIVGHPKLLVAALREPIALQTSLIYRSGGLDSRATQMFHKLLMRYLTSSGRDADD